MCFKSDNKIPPLDYSGSIYEVEGLVKLGYCVFNLDQQEFYQPTDLGVSYLLWQEMNLQHANCTYVEASIP